MFQVAHHGPRNTALVPLPVAGGIHSMDSTGRRGTLTIVGKNKLFRNVQPTFGESLQYAGGYDYNERVHGHRFTGFRATRSVHEPQMPFCEYDDAYHHCASFSIASQRQPLAPDGRRVKKGDPDSVPLLHRHGCSFSLAVSGGLGPRRLRPAACRPERARASAARKACAGSGQPRRCVCAECVQPQRP